MDYPFFVWRIGTAPADLVEEFRDYADKAELRNASGFDPRHGLLQQAGGDARWKALCQRLRAELDPMFAQHIVDVNINRLGARREVGEHTDTVAYDTTIPSYAWQPYARHTVHIPLRTNNGCVSKHRRSKAASEVAVTHLPKGGIFLYNNVCWHSVHNYGDEDRDHLFIKVQDDIKFSVKRALFLHHKCQFGYEGKEANVPVSYEPFRPQARR